MNDQRSIELFENVDFQRRQWRWQRVGWLLMGLFAGAGLLGMFGKGPYSTASEISQNGALRVDYERFARRDSRSSLRAALAPQAVAGGRVEVRIDRSYVDSMLIQSVVPEPAQVAIGAEDLSYHFDAAQSGREIVVTFEFEAKRAGRLHPRLRLADGTEVAFVQFIYP